MPVMKFYYQNLSVFNIPLMLKVFCVKQLPPFGNQADKVRPYLLASLKDLQLDYVDLYLVHTPCGIVETEAIKKGNLSNMVLDNTTDLEALWKVRVKKRSIRFNI